ncbi:hypothetical protein HID58_001892 [Brassica napus]|nr:hypothetical protein HID58_001892 [Brassica napus]
MSEKKDMVVTSRSSSSSRRFCSSSSSSLEPSSSSPLFTKRSKVKIDTAIEYVRDGGNGGVFIGERGSIDNQGPVSDPGSESGELELGSSYPQDMDAEKPMSVMEISLEADTNPETDVLPTPTIPEEISVVSLRIQSYGESLHILPQLLALSELEFNKAFLGMCLCLQVKITAEEIQGWKDLSIVAFEVAVWEHLGKDYCSPTDRRLSLDWDTGKTHHYYQCHVASDGSYTFKCFDRDFFLSLEPVGTYLQKVLGDDNVLTVVFEDLQKNSSTCSIDPYSAYKRIAKNGIKIGLRRYQLFVFKDGGKEKNKKDFSTTGVKCYFIRTDSTSANDPRSSYIFLGTRMHFMHVHTLPSSDNYMVRFSLILSKTKKLEVDMTGITFEIIDDIHCHVLC